MSSDSLIKVLADSLPTTGKPVCVVYSAMVESVRNIICALSTDRYASRLGEEYKFADIRNIMYLLRTQYVPLIRNLDLYLHQYFFTQENTINPFSYIIKIMSDAGEITCLTHGKYILSPYKVIDIGISDKVIVQGGVTASEWLVSGKCVMNGVTRLVHKSVLADGVTYKSYPLETWLLLPYKGDKLIEWTKSTFYELSYSKINIDTPISVYNPCIKDNLQVNKWLDTGELYKTTLEYTVAKSKGVDGYSYWVLKNVHNGTYEGIASIGKFFATRLLYGLDAIYNNSTNIFYSTDEDLVYLHFPNRIPLDEMRLIRTIAYPWPVISKYGFKWVITKNLWDVVKSLFLNLKVNFIVVSSSLK